jgi:hypothetical protein
MELQYDIQGEVGVHKMTGEEIPQFTYWNNEHA